MLAGRPGAPGAGDPPGPPDGGGRPRPGASLDMKIHLEKNLEEERQILLQQQKICRNRARRYFIESNRRKKAFEEKRKEQEEREYQIREQILQQRKQKFEEVTEKFQRAHIPFSQRRKAAFQKPVPPLDEALKQIQESNIKSEVNIPIFHHSAVNWRAIDSALSSALSKNDHKHHNYLLRKINCDKEKKESNMKDLATNKYEFQLKLEETQKLLQDQHLSSLQKFCDEVYQITNSETLSSVDSLEAAEREKMYLKLTREFAASMQQNSLSFNAADLQSFHLNCSDEDKLSFSKTQHINNWLTNLDVQNTKSVSSYSNMLSNSSVPPLWECLSNKEQTPATLSRPVLRATSASNDSVVFVYSPPIVALDGKGGKACEGSTPKPSESTWGAPKRETPQETPRETLSVTESPAHEVNKAWTNPQSFTQEAATSTLGKKLSEFIQENKTALFVPAATPLVLSPNAQSARPLVENNIRIKEIHPVQCSDKLHELKDVKDEKIKYFNCNKEELPLFSDNFQATSVPQNSNSNDRKQKTAGTSVPSSGVIADYDLFDQHKKMKCNTHKQNNVSLLKSILKKESKYEHDCLKTLIINQGFKFRNKKAEAIRDSIELTKEKGKSAEIPKTIKKLRWFDETGNTGSNADNSHSVKNRTGMTHGWSPQHHLLSSTDNKATGVPNSAASTKPRADSLSENVVDLGGAKRDHVPLNCFMPSGCGFTKQARSACRTPVHNGDSKTQKGKPYKDRGRVLRRAGAAKVQSGLTYANKKGTVLHPQSTSNAKMLTQTQGKLIIPHPPKPPSNMRSGKNTQVSQCQSIMPENTHNVMAQNCVDSTHVPPVEHSLNQWNQEGSPPLSDACSDLVTVIPSNCSSECQTSAKTHPSSMASQQDGTLHGTQRGPVCEEHYQSFPHMEDSLFSWKRRTSRLCQNERATDSTITRRKETVESKWRNHLEQKSTHTGPVGMKYAEQMSNFGQSAQPSSSEPKQGTRGSSNTEESILEFLMADNLLDSSESDDEITMGAMSKLQKAHVSLRQSQQPSVCTLSAEEQKILQSLSRLNHRLYYVQEAICKNPSIKNTLQLIPLPNSQPKASVCPDVGPRLQRKY